jgi:hypothetical protein
LHQAVAVSKPHFATLLVAGEGGRVAGADSQLHLGGAAQSIAVRMRSHSPRARKRNARRLE